MNRFFGVLSLLLIVLACGIGFFSILNSSVLFSTIYILTAAIGSLIIIFAFCTKCECRSETCGHVIPGKITKILPEREQTEYSAADYFLTFISLFLIAGFPQFWLVKNTCRFTAFWILMVIAVLMIMGLVCRKCENKKCPVCNKINSENG